MEDYLFKKCRTIKGEEINSKPFYSPKKKRIKAYEIPAKEFFSDDEDNDSNIKNKNFGIINKFTKQRKIKINSINKFSKNSILIYRDQLQKKSTMDKTPSKKSERLIFNEEKILKDKTKSNNNKKVSFAKDNFVTYINVECYKKYNFDNSSKEPYASEKIKEESKCCLIY
jgi:hypothetical protein